MKSRVSFVYKLRKINKKKQKQWNYSVKCESDYALSVSFICLQHSERRTTQTHCLNSTNKHNNWMFVYVFRRAFSNYSSYLLNFISSNLGFNYFHSGQISRVRCLMRLSLAGYYSTIPHAHTHTHWRPSSKLTKSAQIE